MHSSSPLPTTQQSASSFGLVIFVALDMLHFLVLCTITVSFFYGEYIERFSSGSVFLSCYHGLDFGISSFENPINQ